MHNEAWLQKEQYRAEAQLEAKPMVSKAWNQKRLFIASLIAMVTFAIVGYAVLCWMIG